MVNHPIGGWVGRPNMLENGRHHPTYAGGYTENVWHHQQVIVWISILIEVLKKGWLMVSKPPGSEMDDNPLWIARNQEDLPLPIYQIIPVCTYLAVQRMESIERLHAGDMCSQCSMQFPTKKRKHKVATQERLCSDTFSFENQASSIHLPQFLELLRRWLLQNLQVVNVNW